MPHELRLPDLGEGTSEGEITRWLVAEGDEVAIGEPLLELQTDKATVEVPSPTAGFVLAIVAPVGSVAPVGAILAIIGAPGESILHAVEPLAPAPKAPYVTAVPDEVASIATPLTRARRAAGRRVPIRGIRRAIVEQVERTHREIPAVTFVEECDFTGLDGARLLPYTLHASARALRAHPELNARIDGEEILHLEQIDIGVVISTEDGIVVPVVRHCVERSVDELERELGRLVAGARAGTLAAEEMRGSTFTVTGPGHLGGLFATPLINHPEVAILGVHRISERPVVVAREVVVRSIGNISVTFDHRVVDGTAAAAFCLAVIEVLQSFRR